MDKIDRFILQSDYVFVGTRIKRILWTIRSRIVVYIFIDVYQFKINDRKTNILNNVYDYE